MDDQADCRNSFLRDRVTNKKPRMKRGLFFQDILKPSGACGLSARHISRRDEPFAV